MATYKCLKPHAKTIEAWKEAGYIPSDLDVKSQEQTFLQAVGRGKSKSFTFGIEPEVQKYTILTETEETADRPIKREITKMHRTEEGNVYYTEMLTGEKWDDRSDINHVRVVGKFNLPTFKIRRNPETGSTTGVSIKDIKTEAEIPLTEGKFTDPSTGEQTSLEELHRMASRDFIFYVKTYARTYSLRGITLDDFINRPFEDLVYRGETKTWPPSEDSKPKKKVKADEA